MAQNQKKRRGRPSAGQSAEQIVVRVPSGSRDALYEIAKNQKTTISTLIRTAIAAIREKSGK